MATTIDQLHRIGALELGDRFGIDINANTSHARDFPFHDHPTPKVSFDVSGVWRHHRDDRLAEPGGRLRSEITGHQKYRPKQVTRRLLERASYDVKIWLDLIGT